MLDLNKAIGLLIIIGSLITHQAEAMIVKHYGNKHGKGGMFFNAILCLFATVFYFITDKDGIWAPTGILIYGLINSTMYATGFYTGYVAYNTGSFGLTRLFSSFSSIIAIVYGIAILKEPTTPFTYISIVLIFVAVFLMQYQKGSGEKAKFSLKWVISIILVVVSNGLISIIGKMQNVSFGSTYKNEFLIVSFLGSTLWLLLLGFIFERKNFKQTMKHGLLYGLGAGAFNGMTNLLILITYNYLDISFISPVKTGLGMVLAFAVSLLFYKEKFSRRQMLGVLIGIIAVILISLPTSIFER